MQRVKPVGYYNRKAGSDILEPALSVSNMIYLNYSKGMISSATMLITLIIGLIAGPAVSL